jgi:hypothetical protein
VFSPLESRRRAAENSVTNMRRLAKAAACWPEEFPRCCAERTAALRRGGCGLAAGVQGPHSLCAQRLRRLPQESALLRGGNPGDCRRSCGPHSLFDCEKRTRPARCKRNALKVDLSQTFGASSRRENAHLRQSGAENCIAPASITLALTAIFRVARSKAERAGQEAESLSGSHHELQQFVRETRAGIWLSAAPRRAFPGHEVPAAKPCRGVCPKRLSLPPYTAHSLWPRPERMGGAALRGQRAAVLYGAAAPHSRRRNAAN